MFAVVVLALAVQVPSRTAATTALLAGCVSDSTAERLPGTTIVATRDGLKRNATADDNGCYELKDLTPGPYRVTARLTGFDNVTRDALILPPAAVTRLDFTMRLSAICECVRITGSLAQHWNHADAVLYARLSPSNRQLITPQGYYRHVATVLNALKLPRGQTAHAGPIFVLQNQSSGAPGPYDVGQELVMFLVSSRSNGFFITNDEPGLVAPVGGEDPSMVFLVQNRRIQRTPPDFSHYVGMGIGVFLNELRAIGRRQSGGKSPGPFHRPKGTLSPEESSVF